MVSIRWSYLLVVVLFARSSVLVGQTLESAASYTRDSQFKRQDVNTLLEKTVPLDELEQLTTKVSANVGYSSTHRISSDSVLEQTWDSRDQIEEKRGGVGVNQDFYKKFGLGVNYQRRASQISSGYSWAASTYAWFLRETLRVTLSHAQNEDKVKVIDTLDTDVTRILTPDRLSGKINGIEVLNLFTPTLLFQANVAQIIRNDRPDAWTYALSSRNFFPTLEGAVHLTAGYFQNVGEFKPVTLQGEVTGKSMQAEWHQRVLSSFILMTGYRYYLEHQNPRSANTEDKEKGSDWFYGRLTYRHWDELNWSLPSNEIYLFGGHYRNSDDLNANTMGIGAKLLLY